MPARTLAENATYLRDTVKPAIKSAIEAQGVTVSGNASFLDYADLIGDISGGGGTTLNTIYSGKESQYISDTTNVAHAFDIRTVGDDFAEYLSTSDYATFTVLKDFDAIVTVGVMEDANHTGVNPPSCSFYINGITSHNDNDTDTGVLGVTASSGQPLATGYTHFCMSFKTGDTFFWGSRTTRGWTVRLGQIDVINGLDMSGYVQPIF